MQAMHTYKQICRFLNDSWLINMRVFVSLAHPAEQFTHVIHSSATLSLRQTFHRRRAMHTILPQWVQGAQ